MQERESRKENFAHRNRLNIVARSLAAISITAAGVGAAEKSGAFDLLEGPVDSANYLVLDTPHKAYEQLIERLPGAENAEAQEPTPTPTPDPYIRYVTVNGVEVMIAQILDGGAEPADVDRVHDEFVAAVNGSTLMKDRVTAAPPPPDEDTTIMILVYEDDPKVYLGGASDNYDFINVDVGDADAILPYLEGLEGDNALIVANSTITWALAHEIVHLLGVPDPHIEENPVILELSGFERLSYYGYCRVSDRTEHIPFKVGSDTGSLNNTAFTIARENVGGVLPPVGAACGSSVGGIAEFPDVQALQNMNSEKSKDNTLPIAAGAAAAVTAVTAAGAVLYIRRKRSS